MVHDRYLPRDAALRTLRDELRRVRRDKRPRLPTVAALAARAGVAKNTMLRAVRSLVAEGELSAKPGVGLRPRDREQEGLVACPGGGVSQPAARCRWQRTVRAVRQDIHSDALGVGALPAPAALAQRYGVSLPTFRRVLAALVSERLLVVRRGRYARAYPAAPPHATILLLARGELRGDRAGSEAVLSPISARTVENLRALEQYCARTGVRLQHVPCYFQRSAVHAGYGPSELERLLRDRAVVGALIWVTALTEGAVVHLVQRLRARALPVAVLDEVATLRDSSALAGLPGVSSFSLACRSVDGLAVGRYLLQLGHRRVACLTGWPEQGWSRNRLAGVRQAYDEAGFGRAVSVFAAGELEDVTHEQRVLGSVRDVMGRALSSQIRHPDGKRAVVGGTPPLFDDLRVAVHRALLRRRLQPAVRRAAADTGITAWVGVNDAVALEALDQLRFQQVGVPRNVSLVGFDNTMEGAYRGLTSYDFNGPALVRAMVDHVVSGGASAASDVVPEGFVVERSTTARQNPIGQGPGMAV